ncbi:hypothetical protein B0H13DRAFT_1856335 [Mycena leptocephala]|nr:hypothetical protein B0H13DRAFT_1856335 [Mycena leptocephala]
MDGAGLGVETRVLQLFKLNSVYWSMGSIPRIKYGTLRPTREASARMIAYETGLEPTLPHSSGDELMTAAVDKLMVFRSIGTGITLPNNISMTIIPLVTYEFVDKLVVFCFIRTGVSLPSNISMRIVPLVTYLSNIEPRNRRSVPSVIQTRRRRSSRDRRPKNAPSASPELPPNASLVNPPNSPKAKPRQTRKKQTHRPAAQINVTARVTLATSAPA